MRVRESTAPLSGKKRGWKTYPEAGRDTRHDGRHESVEVTVSGRSELESSEADIVESLVIDTERLVRVFDELVNRKGRVVRLDDRVGNLGRRHDRERRHHAVGVLFADLGDQEGTHTGSRSSSTN